MGERIHYEGYVAVISELVTAVNNLIDVAEKLERDSHPPITFSTCPDCFALCVADELPFHQSAAHT